MRVEEKDCFPFVFVCVLICVHLLSELRIVLLADQIHFQNFAGSFFFLEFLFFFSFLIQTKTENAINCGNFFRENLPNCKEL